MNDSVPPRQDEANPGTNTAEGYGALGDSLGGRPTAAMAGGSTNNLGMPGMPTYGYPIPGASIQGGQPVAPSGLFDGHHFDPTMVGPTMTTMAPAAAAAAAAGYPSGTTAGYPSR